MSCNACLDIYDLGNFEYCGIQELSIQIPSPGLYILQIQYLNYIYKYSIETTVVNQKPSINFSTLPLQTEMIFTIVNVISKANISIDIIINTGTTCDPVLLTKCYSIFKFKSILSNES